MTTWQNTFHIFISNTTFSKRTLIKLFKGKLFTVIVVKVKICFRLQTKETPMILNTPVALQLVSDCLSSADLQRNRELIGPKWRKLAHQLSRVISFYTTLLWWSYHTSSCNKFSLSMYVCLVKFYLANLQRPS